MPTSCPVCDTTTTSPDARFCILCGWFLAPIPAGAAPPSPLAEREQRHTAWARRAWASQADGLSGATPRPSLNGVDEATATAMPAFTSVEDPTVTSMQAVPVGNSRHTGLEFLLADGAWVRADEETARLLLAAAGKPPGSTLTPEELYKLPVEELLDLDRVWSAHSGGRLGFGVQLRVYKRLRTAPGINGMLWDRLTEQLGWAAQGRPVPQPRSSGALPTGHLPWLPRLAPPMMAEPDPWIGLHALFARLEESGI